MQAISEACSLECITAMAQTMRSDGFTPVLILGMQLKAGHNFGQTQVYTFAHLEDAEVADLCAIVADVPKRLRKVKAKAARRSR